MGSLSYVETIEQHPKTLFVFRLPNFESNPKKLPRNFRRKIFKIYHSSEENLGKHSLVKIICDLSHTVLLHTKFYETCTHFEQRCFFPNQNLPMNFILEYWPLLKRCLLWLTFVFIHFNVKYLQKGPAFFQLKLSSERLTKGAVLLQHFPTMGPQKDQWIIQ